MSACAEPPARVPESVLTSALRCASVSPGSVNGSTGRQAFGRSGFGVPSALMNAVHFCNVLGSIPGAALAVPASARPPRTAPAATAVPAAAVRIR